MVRLGEELEQSAQAEARERENARYYQQRLQDMRLEMEELTQREQESSRRRMELVTEHRPTELKLFYPGRWEVTDHTLLSKFWRDVLLLGSCQTAVGSRESTLPVIPLS